MQNLTGRFLIAMPQIEDKRFTQVVAYVCEHADTGAMAVVINRPITMSLSRIIEGMDIAISNPKLNHIPVLAGGPMQPELGCVLHPKSGEWASTFDSGDICITTSKDILHAIAAQTGPETALVTLGYLGWKGDQLDQELANNMWLTSKASTEILFEVPVHKRWQAAVNSLGINPLHLSRKVGHA